MVSRTTGEAPGTAATGPTNGATNGATIIRADFGIGGHSSASPVRPGGDRGPKGKPVSDHENDGRVSFGIELPAGRNDLVASIAALTQLLSIADEQGVDADPSLRQAIIGLRRALEGASVMLPPHLSAMLDILAPLEEPDPTPPEPQRPQPGKPGLRVVE